MPIAAGFRLMPPWNRSHTSNNGDTALTLIEQHMHDCEIRADRFEKRLDDQDEASKEMHKENGARLTAIESQNRTVLLLLFVAVLGLAGNLAFDLVKSLRSSPVTAVQGGPNT